MAMEYGPHGVSVNCVAPAAIMTPMRRESNPAKSVTFDEELFLGGLRTPLRRYGTPEEIACVALATFKEEVQRIREKGPRFTVDSDHRSCWSQTKARAAHAPSSNWSNGARIVTEHAAACSTASPFIGLDYCGGTDGVL